MAELLIVVVVLGFMALWMWGFYLWGADIAQGKGRSRALGWWSAFFGIAAIIVLALLPRGASPGVYKVYKWKDSIGVAEQIERLAALRDRGHITNEEFEQRKRALLSRA